MYFLWRNTPYGTIRVSCEGLYDLAGQTVRSRIRLYGVTLSPSGRKENADFTVVLSEEDLMPETKKKVEKHFDAILKPMGLKVSVVWASPERGIFPLMGSPYLWAGIAACIAVIVSAGFAGFFWVAFWGAAVWFTVSGLKVIARRFRSA